MDAGLIQLPQHITRLFDNITVALDNIIRHINNSIADEEVLVTALLNSEIEVDNLRQELNNTRNQLLRSEDNRRRADQVNTIALHNKTQVQRHWHTISQQKEEKNGRLLRKKFGFRLICQCKDRQIAEHRRTAH